jgi:flagellar motility protein MotE (MotC chaperone)
MRFLIFIFLTTSIFSAETSKVDKSKLLNCYDIFEQRRAELEGQLAVIEEQKQAFQALKDATMNIINKKKTNLENQQKELNATLTKIETNKKEIKDLVEQNKKILQQIKEAQTDKLVQTYSKMRAGNAASILQDMDENASIDILYRLSPKVLSKIFSKMDTQKAAVLSTKLKNYKPKSEKK